MDLKDAMLAISGESAAHPGLAKLAESAYDQLLTDGWVDYRVLEDLIAQASGKGVLRGIHRKYGPVGRDAVFGPILREIDRRKPVPPRGTASARPGGPDPLTAAT